jgi:hypothetical protein
MVYRQWLNLGQRSNVGKSSRENHKASHQHGNQADNGNRLPVFNNYASFPPSKADYVVGSGWPLLTLVAKGADGADAGFQEHCGKG